MHSGKIVFLYFILLLLNMAACDSYRHEPATNIKMPAIFGDQMVLQQKMQLPIWGTADPGGKVEVTLGDHKNSTIVSKEGHWQVKMAALKAGGPYELTVKGKEATTFTNVMVGEVYICSGQSNMEMAVASVKNAEQEIAEANYPGIRLLTVQKNIALVPLSDITTAGWQECSPKTIPNFSATGYFFGRHLHKILNIPIGLIHSSWGGTPAEAWTSSASLKLLPDFAEQIQEQELSSEEQQQRQQDYEKSMATWQQAQDKWIETLEQHDSGLKGAGATWNDPAFDASQWPTMPLPRLWESSDIGNYDGIVWFRKEISLPNSWQRKNLTLHLGPIDDIDVTWFNGTQVGSEKVYNLPRKYPIPAALVKPGRNVIAVRVLDYGGGGGLWGKSHQLKLITESGDSLSLAGNWHYQVGVDLASMPEKPQTPTRPNHQLSVLYNAMIAPLIPYGIRGAIWYQGEANAGRAHQYRTLFPALIKDWRSHWGQGNFPFLFVQLANFLAVQPEPGDNDWAELREAQLMTLSVPNTGMAVIIDIGEADDIHPKNKQDVGERLALNARHLAYGENITYSGPIYRSMTVEQGQIRLTFDHVDGGLMAKDGASLTGFAIAGADNKFYWADASIDGATVVVKSPQVAEPLAVRYAWAANPVCNLYNKDGLPAAPFRTDSWPGITAGVK